MKKLLLMALTIMLIPAGLVLAGTERTADRDTFFGTGADENGNDLRLWGQDPPPADGVCVDNNIAYISWDLSGETQVIHSAYLVLTSVGPASGATDIVYAVHAANSEAWDETDTVAPGYGAELATSAATTINGAGQTVVFEHSTTLGAYFESKKGGTATIAVRMKSGCGPASFALFGDREVSFSPTADPDLIFNTVTAVGLSETNSTSNNNNMAFVWVSVALVLVTMAGLFLVRKQEEAPTEL